MTGTRELVLTKEQCVALRDWLDAHDRLVCIGSVGPRAYEPGMEASRIGEIVAVVGRVPRERLEAVRQAARGEIKASRKKRMTAPAKL